MEFVDSNVLVYAHTADESSKHARARILLTRLIQESAGALSFQTLAEFYNAATRKVGLSHKFAMAALHDLAHIPTHQPALQDIARAGELQTRHRISFWDAMIVNSAIEMDCSVLWTEDLNDGQKFGNLVVRNPFR